MSECNSSIDSVKRVKLILNDEEELEDPGLTSSTADKQTSTGALAARRHSAHVSRNLYSCNFNNLILELAKFNTSEQQANSNITLKFVSSKLHTVFSVYSKSVCELCDCHSLLQYY